jgi:hypothetical protein
VWSTAVEERESLDDGVQEMACFIGRGDWI